jgi:GR25 family glycosyltransferase involved in LPS biosynthesis
LRRSSISTKFSTGLKNLAEHKMFVTFYVDGRFANNLFQYFAAKVLAENIGFPFRYSTRGSFDSSTLVVWEQSFETLLIQLRDAEFRSRFIDFARTKGVTLRGYFQTEGWLKCHDLSKFVTENNGDQFTDEFCIRDIAQAVRNSPFDKDVWIVHIRLEDFVHNGHNSEIVDPDCIAKLLDTKVRFIVCRPARNVWEQEFLSNACSRLGASLLSSNNPIEDFALLYNAPNLVLCRSTFGWMAAQLSSKQERIYFPICTSIHSAQKINGIKHSLGYQPVFWSPNVESQEADELANLLARFESINFNPTQRPDNPPNEIKTCCVSDSQKDAESNTYWIGPAGLHETLETRPVFSYKSSSLSTKTADPFVPLFDTNKLISTLLATCSTWARGLVVSELNATIPDREFVDCTYHPETRFRPVSQKEATEHYYSCVIDLENLQDRSYKTDCYVTRNFRKACKFAHVYKLTGQLFVGCSVPLSSWYNRVQLRELNCRILSLQKSYARRQHICSQLDKSLIEYQVVYAADGAKVNIIPEGDTVNVKFDQLVFKHNPNARRLKMSYGEFGCAITHLRQAWQVHCGEPCLIFEDDANIINLDCFLRQIRLLPRFELWDVCYLQNDALWYPPSHRAMLNEHFSINKAKASNCLHAYILTSRGAGKISKFCGMNLDLPADDIVGKLVASGDLLSISPGRRLVGTTRTKSDIWNVFKPDESYTNVVWDKPLYAAPSIYVADMGDWSRLGNQMYQYAVAVLCSLDRNAEVSVPSMRLRTGQITLSKSFPMFSHKPVEREPSVVVKEAKEFEPLTELLCKTALRESIFLKGYFQNADYFKGREALVKELFRFHDSLERRADRRVRQIRALGFTPVSIHIRLKDNPHDPSEFIYTIWTPETLSKAMNKLDVPNPFYLIHSSDFQECERIFGGLLARVKHVLIKEDESTSLAIMTHTENHIISASSYSWWGAWLAQQRFGDKCRVIIPSPWFNPKVERVAGNWVEGLYVQGWEKFYY